MSWSRLVALAFPTTCPGCGVEAPAICGRCRTSLLPPSVLAPPDEIDWWVAPFAYGGAVRRLIVGAKYRQARTGLAWLAEEVAAAVADAHRPTLDVVTWVPAHPLRRRQRGFDQGRLLATGVAARLGLPARRLLRRVGGGPQTGSARSARTVGPVLQATAPLTGRAVLVIDDVATTGASLAAAAQALRDAGARHVAAATAARTELGAWQSEEDLPGSAGSARSSDHKARPTLSVSGVNGEPFTRQETRTMDPILRNDTPAPVRAAAVQRLRRQVSTGAYIPPVEALVERLVSLLVGDATVGRRTLPSQTPRGNGRV